MLADIKQRDRLDWLSTDEAADMDKDFASGRSNGEVARKFFCSMRTVQKRKASWQNKAGSPHHRSKLVLPTTPPARPHMQPGLTLAMLMGCKRPAKMVNA